MPPDPIFAQSAPAAQETRAIDDNVLVQYLFEPVTSTDEIVPGMAVCLDPTQSVVANRFLKVQKPTETNMHLYVGTVAPQCKRVKSGQFVKVVPPDRLVPGVPLYTDQNIVAGDLLGVHPNTYRIRKGTCKGPIIGRAAESVDRSTTAGPVRCWYGPLHITAAERAKYVRRIEEDFETFGTTLVSGSPYGIQQVNGSVTVPAGSATASKNGVVQLNATGADNDQCFLYSAKNFRLELGKPLIAEFWINLLTSVSTPDLIFGLINGDVIAAAVPFTAADALSANNTFDGLAVYKLTGSTTLNVVGNRSAATAAQQTAALTGSAATVAASTSRKIGIFYDGIAGTVNTGGTVTIYLDDVANAVQLGFTAANLPNFNMGLFCGVKSQGAAEAFQIDRWFAEQPA